MVSRHSLFLFLLLVLLTPLVAQRPAPSVQTEIAGGANKTTFETKLGKIHVNLPDDMAAGDTISGTVIAEPNGKTEKEKQRNTGELNGYVVELENQKSPVSGGVIQRVVLAPTMLARSLILLDSKGKQLAVMPILVLPSAPTAPKAFDLPTLGQTGRPLQIRGPFDGDSSNTSAKIGDTDAKVIAESPRKLVVETPRNVVGPSEIKVTENGTTATGAFRNLKIDLTAPKTSLLKGESTELHVQVNGLEGIAKAVEVQLQNQSPSNINISGGNTQNIVVQPSQVKVDGTFPWSTNVTGTGNGPFIITARVTQEMFFPPSSPGTSTPSPTSSPTPVVPAQTNAKQLDAIVTPSFAQCSPPSGQTNSGPLDSPSTIPSGSARAFPKDRIAKTLHGMWRGQVTRDPAESKNDLSKDVDYFWIFDTTRGEGLIIAQRTGDDSTAGLKPVPNAPKLKYLICPHEGSRPTVEKGSEIHEFVKVSDSIEDAPRILEKATGLKSGTERLTLADLWKGIVASGYFKSLPDVGIAGGFFKPLRLELVPNPIGPAQVWMSWDAEYYGGGSTGPNFNPGVPIKRAEYSQFVGTTTASGDFLVSSPGNGQSYKVEAIRGANPRRAFDSVVLGPLQ